MVSRVDTVGDFPEMGHFNFKLKDLEIREIFETPYQILYRIQRGNVEIIGVAHGARDGF